MDGLIAWLRSGRRGPRGRRDEAVDLTLVALGTARRPSDRMVWLGVWLDNLHATDDEIVAHAQVLIPVLATGDASAVERLAPVLVAAVHDDLEVDVVAALTAPTKKARRALLAALARRPAPGVGTPGG